MAKLTLGPNITAIRNKLGNVVYTRMAQGDVARAYAIPRNNKTAMRVLAQTRYRAAALAWSASLTDTQRIGWQELAHAFPTKSRSSLPGILDGRQLFLRCWLNGLWFTGTTHTDPPPDLNTPIIGEPSLTLDPATQTMNLTFTPSPIPAGMVISVQCSSNVSAGIMRPRYLPRPLEVLLATQTSPVSLAHDFAYRATPVAIGQKVFLTVQPFFVYNNWPGSKLLCSAAATSGGKFLVVKEGARVYRSTTQSIPDSTVTTISFDTARWNVGPMWALAPNPTRLTAVRGGKYQLSAAIAFAANATGVRLAAIKLNGSTLTVSNTKTPTAANECDMAISTTYFLNPGDYVELVTYQDSGAPLNLDAANAYTSELSAAWLSD